MIASPRSDPPFPPRAAAILALLLPAAASADVTFFGLGHDSRFAFGVSADGGVVVGYGHYMPPYSAAQAFRWTPSGGLQTYPGDPWYNETFALGVSRDGSVTVGASNGTAARLIDGEWQSIGGLPGWSNSVAIDASADGSVIAGNSHPATGAESAAYRWTASGGAIGLNAVAGNTATQANAISDDGSIVVGSSYDAAMADNMQAVRWLADGTVDPLGTMPSSRPPLSYANGVSGDGSFVVGASTSSVAWTEAFLWHEGEGMTGLGLLPAGGFSVATDVSDDGRLVVGYGDSSHVDSTGAFVWTPGSGIRELREVLDDDFGLGDQLVGWQLDHAYGVSPDGRFIVGSGNFFGRGEAWVLDLGVDPAPIPPRSFPAVPEPSTYGWLGAAGLLALIVLRLRLRGGAAPGDAA